MNCYKCGKGISEGKNMFPIDPPKTPNRRWACTDCMDAEQIKKISTKVREITFAICGDSKLNPKGTEEEAKE